jgi:esterase/lipase superfamily enzyme
MFATIIASARSIVPGGRIVKTDRIGSAAHALRLGTACLLIASIVGCAAHAPRGAEAPPPPPPPPAEPVGVAPDPAIHVPAATEAPPPPVHIAHAAPHMRALAAPLPLAKYKKVDVLYATDRLRNADAGGLVGFGGGRGSAIEYGTCEVSIPNTHREGVLETPSFLEFHEDPEKHVVLLAVQPATHDAFIGDLAARVAAAPGRTALVFVHGYYVTFEDAARRTAQIAYDIHFAGVPMFFSWPSLGQTLAYPIDMTNADWAQFDLKSLLIDLADHSGADNIVLIAHSMGNRVLANALIQAAEARPGFAARVRDVVLAAPDLDADTFRRDLAPRLIAATHGMTLYASSTDDALAVSHHYNGELRAGDVAAGPIVVSGMDTIDVSAVDPGPLGHSYIGDSPSVLDDVAKLVDGGARAAARLGDPVTGPLGAYWRMAAAVVPSGGTH